VAKSDVVEDTARLYARLLNSTSDDGRALWLASSIVERLKLMTPREHRLYYERAATLREEAIRREREREGES